MDIEEYAEEVDAREDGPACPLPTARARYLVHEDCLRLNVYTPDNNRLLDTTFPSGVHGPEGAASVGLQPVPG